MGGQSVIDKAKNTGHDPQGQPDLAAALGAAAEEVGAGVETKTTEDAEVTRSAADAAASEATQDAAAILPPDDGELERNEDEIEETASAPAGDESGQVEDEPADTGPIDETTEEEEPEKDWFILKVQSNREDSIRDGLQRRVAVAGLQEYFGDIIVPTEEIAEFKSGKKRIVKRKLYPGYIVVHMVINDDTWFLVRETPGIGDFTGSAGKPTPMLPHEVDRIVNAAKPEAACRDRIKTAIPFKHDVRERIKEGTFENFDGDVDAVDEANGRVIVMINIFGRSTPVELEHWQIESV